MPSRRRQKGWEVKGQRREREGERVGSQETGTCMEWAHGLAVTLLLLGTDFQTQTTSYFGEMNGHFIGFSPLVAQWNKLVCDVFCSPFNHCHCMKPLNNQMSPTRGQTPLSPVCGMGLIWDRLVPLHVWCDVTSGNNFARALVWCLIPVQMWQAVVAWSQLCFISLVVELKYFLNTKLTTSILSYNSFNVGQSNLITYVSILD